VQCKQVATRATKDRYAEWLCSLRLKQWCDMCGAAGGVLVRPMKVRHPGGMSLVRQTSSCARGAHEIAALRAIQRGGNREGRGRQALRSSRWGPTMTGVSSTEPRGRGRIRAGAGFPAVPATRWSCAGRWHWRSPQLFQHPPTRSTRQSATSNLTQNRSRFADFYSSRLLFVGCAECA
jgi:hypothetical protein